jgi:hypothetical protein
VITLPLAYSRRFYQEEEVIISLCNYCETVVGESRDEAELTKLEMQHRCAGNVKASAA